MLCLRGWMASLLVIACIGAMPARAEVSVSITITGPVEELVPILAKLQELGLGGASADPLKLNVHSVMTSEDAPAEPAPAPEGQPSFESVSVEPAAAKAGDSVLVTAKVADLNRAIDTVAASIGDQKIDLFDNGTHGDVTAGDGIWSHQVTLPATLAAGELAVAVHAYNANGEPVQVPGPDEQPAPLTAEAKVTITQ